MGPRIPLEEKEVYPPRPPLNREVTRSRQTLQYDPGGAPDFHQPPDNLLGESNFAFYLGLQLDRHINDCLYSRRHPKPHPACPDS